jgi:nondiscriminating aspartyl-tRNA synthetase
LPREPHASSRDLTEYYSLDVEWGFIDGPDVIQLERELRTDMFESLKSAVWAGDPKISN